MLRETDSQTATFCSLQSTNQICMHVNNNVTTKGCYDDSYNIKPQVRSCPTYLSPGCHHTQVALDRSSGRKSEPLYGSVRLMGVARVDTFDPPLNICTDRMGVATVSRSPESNRYEFKAGPRLENNAMATEELGVVRGSSNEAKSSDSVSVSEKSVNPCPVAVDGCLVLIKRFS